LTKFKIEPRAKFLGGGGFFPDTSGVLARNFCKHPLRMTGRGLWLCGAFLFAALDYVVTVAFGKKERRSTARGLWLQRNSRRVLRVVRTQIRIGGPVPKRGLLVCNHLSYLDILVIAATAPASFVSKSEIRHWPVFGWFARIAGTIFVRREKRSDVTRAASEMKAALEAGLLLVLFAEGMSSNGETVLPFKSSLLEPAAKSTHPLQVGYINYAIEDGDVVEEVYYWRDMTLLPHLLNLLSKRRLSARVVFAPVPEAKMGRKELARKLHAEVLGLKNGMGT